MCTRWTQCVPYVCTYIPPCMCVQALKWDTSGTSQHSTPHWRANLIGNSCKDLSAEQLPSCIVMATTICSLFHRDARPVSGYKEVGSTAHLALVLCEWAGVQPALVLVTVCTSTCARVCVCVCVCVHRVDVCTYVLWVEPKLCCEIRVGLDHSFLG